MFKVGMKVVCISVLKIRESRYNSSLSRLQKDSIYTIENVVENGNGLVLREVKSDHPLGAYYIKRFRPVQDQYTEEEIEAVNIDELTKEKELIEI